ATLWDRDDRAVAEVPDRLHVPDVDDEDEVDVPALAHVRALDDLLPHDVPLGVLGPAVDGHAADVEAGGDVGQAGTAVPGQRRRGAPGDLAARKGVGAGASRAARLRRPDGWRPRLVRGEPGG